MGALGVPGTLGSDLWVASRKTMTGARPGTLGIVREAYSKWERRAPLTPTHVARLVEQGIRVHVQPCDRRVFSNVEYEKAGAVG